MRACGEGGLGADVLAEVERARLYRFHQLHVAVQDVQVERRRERDRERQQDRQAAAQLTAHLGDAQTENGRLTQLVASLQQAEEEVRQAAAAHAAAAASACA